MDTEDTSHPQSGIDDLIVPPIKLQRLYVHPQTRTEQNEKSD